ncbi:FadR/GntR family transcriptional regulator [Tropicimonas sp. IMCC6043]|uniref:FadR/GntR family transcriptional regulator n=1 Tax=Tropicimonas sp. IMCC6043 TaxID=2510645 RepID=UPI00101C69ED|nr:FadR/GntR family transcriptional regulator [Tropicimonas sp. IMCC6043]RYH07190.1 FadR family transcriptional regulator [Tropicimonas sp. IMCC6043]
MIDSTDKPVFSAKLSAPQRLADAVSEAIATALFDGSIAPGDPLPSEGEIAKEFGVSKPVAREALRHLSGIGLIQTQQGKVARAKVLTGEPLDRIYGYAVRSSLTRLREANEMRRLVEAGIARLAAERRDQKGIAAMQRAVQDMHDTLGQPDKFTEADIAFHLGMAIATGNTMIRMQVEGMQSVQREVSELFSKRASRTLDDWRATVLRHEDLFHAIRDGDPERAGRMIVKHYEAADIASLEVAGDMGGADV